MEKKMENEMETGGIRDLRDFNLSCYIGETYIWETISIAI